MSVRILVQNFGPLAQGEIELSPLTVFIGPNNSGKSYLAMLTYAVLSSGGGSHGSFPGHWRYRYFLPQPPATRALVSEFQSFAEARTADSVPSVGPLLMAHLANQIKEVLRQFGDRLKVEIERCFGSKLIDLARSETAPGTLRLTVTHSDPLWSVTIVQSGKRFITRVKTPSESAVQSMLATSFPRRLPESLIESQYRQLLRESTSHVLTRCFSNFPPFSYYLPAARSGILHGHKALASFVMSQSSLAGIADMDIPKMTGVNSDFIASLIGLSTKKRSTLSEVAEFLESELLNGRIAVDYHPPAYPELTYEANSGSFPLHRTSSMISELAPIVAYIRYLLDPKEQLIIEEPESHLHPASQRTFARGIARLLNRNVRVAFTTHSDYFLAEINNLIRLGSLMTNKAGSRKRDLRVEAIRAKDVAAYLFHPGDKGTVVEPIAVTLEDGISEEEFAHVAEELNDETVRLEYRANQ